MRLWSIVLLAALLFWRASGYGQASVEPTPATPSGQYAIQVIVV